MTAIYSQVAGCRTMADRSIRLTLDLPAEHFEPWMMEVGVSVGIAPLKITTPPKAKPKKHFDELTPAQQAGMLCNDPDFQDFLTVADPDEAAAKVRKICDVDSRSVLTDNDEARSTWNKLVDEYRGWQAEQRYGEFPEAG